MVVLLNLVCKHSSKSINFVVYNTIPSSCLLFFLFPPDLEKPGHQWPLTRVSVAFNDSLQRKKIINENKVRGPLSQNTSGPTKIIIVCKKRTIPSAAISYQDNLLCQWWVVSWSCTVIQSRSACVLLLTYSIIAVYLTEELPHFKVAPTRNIRSSQNLCSKYWLHTWAFYSL